MRVLDTNVLSELMRANVNSAVLAWIDGQDADDLWLTAVTVAEIRHGIARLPNGKRKSALHNVVAAVLDKDFNERILAFDACAAQHYAELTAARERSGRPISMADAQIGAICRSHGAVLATRNAKDFEGIGVDIVNPWAMP